MEGVSDSRITSLSIRVAEGLLEAERALFDSLADSRAICPETWAFQVTTTLLSSAQRGQKAVRRISTMATRSKRDFTGGAFSASLSWRRFHSSSVTARNHCGRKWNKWCSTNACSVRIETDFSTKSGPSGSCEIQNVTLCDGTRQGTVERSRWRVKWSVFTTRVRARERAHGRGKQKQETVKTSRLCDG